MMMDNRKTVILDLIMSNRCSHVVEVGVWNGEMTKFVLNSPAHKKIESYWAVDQWAVLKGTDYGRWANVGQALWEAKYEKVCMLMRYFPALHVVRMPSARAAAMFPEGYFDLVFIDAGHTYEEVTMDIDAWLPKVKSGGLLAGDDYGPVWEGTNWLGRFEVKPAVDDYFSVRDGGVEIIPYTSNHNNHIWFKRI
jgi:hypothetical protein